MTSPTPPSWCTPTPGKLIAGLLAVELGLLTADRFSLFGMERGSGWNLLWAVAVFLIVIAFGLMWFGVALALSRRYQFGLSSILLLMVCLAVVGGWFSSNLNRSQRQREAVEQMRQIGGQVFYDYPEDISGGPANPSPPEPAWLRMLVGLGFLPDVIHVNLLNSEADNATLEHLNQFPNVEHLYLDGQITDTGLEHLHGLTKLKYLCIETGQVTDAGVEHLRGLTDLEYLYIGGPITDAGLECLRGLSSLQRLQLYDTKVTDNGVNELQKALPNCVIDHWQYRRN